MKIHSGHVGLFGLFIAYLLITGILYIFSPPIAEALLIILGFIMSIGLPWLGKRSLYD